MQDLCVPISGDLINEIILRSQRPVDIAGLIENVLEDFLERTRGEADIWSEEHADVVANEKDDPILARYGDPAKGYTWQGIALPNGTQLKVIYRGEDKLAEVRHRQIYFENQPCSPSQFASRAANNTSRNAWRDIWVKRRTDADWVFADLLRTGRAD
jgi:hypothetical protein